MTLPVASLEMTDQTGTLPSRLGIVSARKEYHFKPCAGYEFPIIPFVRRAEPARSCPEPSPERFGGLVRRSRSREFVRPKHIQPTPRIDGRARDNCEWFPSRFRGRTDRGRDNHCWLPPARTRTGAY